ncbi:unnamed protein product [Rangifer tarandus platyrhynchus]|uniref:Uncharacterized protein n=2 Tax=Rangifer tarandus platyrhynchus TaxID=3082113 RepID=A0ABN8YMQ2_RANTA|nr:unnamed protein product [Rangifer tarandus platyrhynchus]
MTDSVPHGCSPSNSLIHGIFQARILELVAIWDGVLSKGEVRILSQRQFHSPNTDPGQHNIQAWARLQKPVPTAWTVGGVSRVICNLPHWAKFMHYLLDSS